jgi:arylsulfatase A-like enzyme
MRSALSLISLVLLLATGGSVVPLVGTAQAQTAQPNVLVIVTDDQRVGTFGMMPAVRRWLVRRGARFPNTFATTPLCCPSRASLLTGLFAHNHGITSGSPPLADMAAVEALMLQSAMQAGGYRTGLFGKYLNGWPLERDPTGWDRWSVAPAGTVEGEEWNLDGDISFVERNSTSFIGGRALDFIEEADQLNDAQPWFAYLGILAPHAPASVSEEYADEPVAPGPPTPAMLETDFHDKPRWLRELAHTRISEVDGIIRRQLRSLISVDDQITRLMLRLEDLEEITDTLVIFTSDNGYMWADHGLRGKLAPYDRSIRVPLVVRWPGRVAAGVRDRRITALLDLPPTILAAADIAFPHEMEGANMLGSSRRRQLLLEFWRVEGRDVPTWRARMTRNTIYVEYLTDAGHLRAREFYDLQEDPHQLSNVLRDGIRGNDPNLRRLHRRVRNLSQCVGSECFL